MFVIGPAPRAFSDSISNMLMQHLCYYVKRRRECDFLAILRGIYFEFQSSTLDGELKQRQQQCIY